MNNKYLSILLLLISHAFSQQNVVMLEGEIWYAGLSDSSQIGSISKFSNIPRASQAFVTPKQNILISNQGRHIVLNQPYSFSSTAGTLTLYTTEKINVEKSGSSLSDAHKALLSGKIAPLGEIPSEQLYNGPLYTISGSQSEILKLTKDLIAKGFPPGTLVLKKNWQHQNGVWDFDKSLFPDPKGMMTDLHKAGFKLLIGVNTAVSPDCPAYNLLAKSNALMLDKNTKNPALIPWYGGVSCFLDISKDAGASYFKNALNRLTKTNEIDGFYFDGSASMALPQNLDVSFNPAEYNKMLGSIAQNYPIHLFNTPYNNGGQPIFVGLEKTIQTHADLAFYTKLTTHANLMGYGFNVPVLNVTSTNQDLILRQIQLAALQPLVSMNANALSTLDASHLSSAKKALNIAKTMLPDSTRMALINDLKINGTPVILPLDYVFPDHSFGNISDQFVINGATIVAPMISAGTRRDVFLPKGTWLSEEGQQFIGPTRVSINVPLDRIPYFVEQKTDPKNAKKKGA